MLLTLCGHRLGTDMIPFNAAILSVINKSGVRVMAMAGAVLVRWYYEALSRRHPDCLLQQYLSGSDDEGVMTVPSVCSSACSRC